MNDRPVIAMNMDFEGGLTPRSYLRVGYHDALWAAGARPMLLPPIADETFIDDALNRADAVLLTGGDDLCPTVYGRERHASCVYVDARRQQFDLALAKKALERNIPLLGICAGLQTINVILGGDLIVDIPSEVPNALIHHSKDPAAPAEHEVEIERRSRLAEILGTDRLVANSFHHQSAGKIGKGLIVVGRTKDGVVEAIERAEMDASLAPLFAVQWHPERISEREPQARLFRTFLDAALRHGNTRRA